MKNLNRALAVVMALVLCLALFAGCGNQQQQGDELVKDYTIKVYSWWDPTHDGILALQNGFEEKYAEYNVKLEFVKISDYYTTMMTKLAANKLSGGNGEQIDVMMLASDKVPQFAAAEVIKPLDELASKEYVDDLYPSVYAGLQFKNQLYAVARDVTSKCMILNLDVFENYGVEVPDENWTVEDFKNICLKFAESEDNVWGYSFDNNPDPLYIWFYLFGGAYFDDVKGESYIDSEGSIKAIQFIYDLIEKDGIMSISETTEYGKFSDAFIKGNAAMISGGLSQVNTVEKGGVTNFKVLPLPTGASGQKQSHTFTNCWTIPTCTTNSAWSWKVLEYFSGPEGQALACNAGMGLPGSQTADITAWTAEKSYRQYFVDALGYEGTEPYPSAEFGAIWQTNFKKLLADNILDISGLSNEQIATICASMNKTLTENLKTGE